MAKKKLRVALIGAGGIAGTHTENYKKFEDVEVVSACDVNAGTLRKFGEKFGITDELKGREKVGDKDCYVLLQSFKDGYNATLYVDAATGLIAKIKAKAIDPTGSGEEVESETIYDDYKSEHGFMVAHKMTASQNGAPIMQMTFTSVTVNANPPDSFFKMK